MWQRIYSLLLPGIVFQSVIVAGGYGSGRELVEFFLSIGPLQGLIGLLIVAPIWSIVCATTFEFSRLFSCYNYRSFFQKLLGRFWWLFEVGYAGVLLIVLSVVVATAGSIVQEELALPYNFGVFALTLYIALMLYRGDQSIEKMLSFWTIALYLLFGTLCFYSFREGSENIMRELSLKSEEGSMFSACFAGIRYAGYNLGLIPAVLFTVRRLGSRTEALSSGLLAGIIAITPGIFLYLSLLSVGGEIKEAPVPTLLILERVGNSFLLVGYNVVMVMTLIETSVGLLHALNERIMAQLKSEKKEKMSWLRAAVGFSFLTASALLAQMGVIDLIAKGYNALTWVMIIVYILPLMTFGIYTIFLDSRKLTLSSVE